MEERKKDRRNEAVLVNPDIYAIGTPCRTA